MSKRSTPVPKSSKGSKVSDDSSSVQSSPWQRDHCWKQTNPKANLSKEQQFYFIFHGSRPEVFTSIMKIKGRRPFDLEIPSVPIDYKVREKPRPKIAKKSLSTVIKIIWEKALKSCKLEQGIVSPRKRILKELEKVTLEEASKRQKAKATVRTVSSHSISSILAKDDDSVLRNLLRSPSPENVRSGIPSTTPFPTHHIHVVHPPTGALFFPQVQSFRTQIHPNNMMWQYPPSSPSQLPLFPSRSYSSGWPHSHRAAAQDTNTDSSDGEYRNYYSCCECEYGSSNCSCSECAGPKPSRKATSRKKTPSKKLSSKSSSTKKSSATKLTKRKPSYSNENERIMLFMQHHLNRDTGLFCCTYCPSFFSRGIVLYRHLIYECLGAPVMRNQSCPYCNFNATSKRTLFVHMFSKHKAQLEV